MKRRILATVLALCLVLGLVPGTAWAEDEPTSGTCGENATWTLSGNTLTISGTGEMKNWDGISDYTPWYSGHNSIKTVIIQAGITSIGDHAFDSCYNLTNVTIPNSVTSIGKDAFSCCYNLTSVTIPNSVTSIGDDAFDQCSSLTSVTIPNSVTFIGDGVFYYCYRLRSVTISNSVTSIGNLAFAHCRSLTSVTIPNSVTSIGVSAFYYCRSLTSVTIPNSVTSIGVSAFSCCSLTSVTIPDSVTSIKKGTFEYCRDLASITIPDSVTSIEGWAFLECSSLTDVFYSGSKSQWSAISIEQGNGKLTSATIHYNGTGPDDPNPPSGDITFRVDSGKDFTIEVGEVLAIVADFSAIDGTTDPTIIWFTGNPEVADIDHTGIGSIGPEVTSAIGWIKGLYPGTAEISVALPDGRTGSCEVEVVIDPNKDTDGDGLYDIWEICGVDTDGDGKPDLDLKAMGADPNVPDIFVEVDWMVRPIAYIEGKTAIVTVREMLYGPDNNTLEMLWDVFKGHGINLHIDAGPDSIKDFETGEKWGELSGGKGEIPYEEIFATGSNNERWAECANKHFTEDRRSVFRYAMFVNQYYREDVGSTSTGISDGIPGQYFIVSAGLVSKYAAAGKVELALAGTFMHELGHTLGLSHGGLSIDGSQIVRDLYTCYKPNYLSVMNYLFQTDGLVGGPYQINYSDFSLPKLNENSLSENMGLDPYRQTEMEDFKIGSKYYNQTRTDPIQIFPVTGAKVDFNGNGKFDTGSVSVDLNRDNKKTTLSSTEHDWPYICYKGGNIGNKQFKKSSYAAGISLSAEGSEPVRNELRIEEALEYGVFASVGTGKLESIGPFSLSGNAKNQNVFLRVFNPASEQVKFDLHIDESSISAGFDQEVTVEPSRTSISYVDIPIAIKDAQPLGSYKIHATLYYSGKEVTDIDIPVSVQAYTPEDIAALKRVIQTGSEEIPETVINEYADILESIENDPTKTYTITFSANGGTGTMPSATITVDEAYTLPVCTFAAPAGNGFKAWLIDGTEYAPGTSLTFTADTTVTAVWQDTEPAPEHTHDWAIAWSHDAIHHWHECNASNCPITSNSGKDGYGPHAYDNDADTVCNTCGYIRTVIDPTDTSYISIPTFTNGAITPTARNAAPGDRVTLYAHPDAGYELDTLTVKDIRGRSITLRSLGDNAYSFTMPNARVTVDASFVKTASNDTPASTPAEQEPFTGLGTPGISGIVLNPAVMPFTDVKSTDWFYNNVDYVWKHYLMSGVSDTQFAPDITTSRAMIWTILARMNNVRTDINPGSTWYERGLLWAQEQGVTDGTNPMSDITREQLATMLWRNAGRPAPGAAADLSRFSDSGTVSEYAQTAVRWAASVGILNGSDGKIDPQGTATRAQVAAMVARYGDRVA